MCTGSDQPHGDTVSQRPGLGSERPLRADRRVSGHRAELMRDVAALKPNHSCRAQGTRGTRGFKRERLESIVTMKD